MTYPTPAPATLPAYGTAVKTTAATINGETAYLSIMSESDRTTYRAETVSGIWHLTIERSFINKASIIRTTVKSTASLRTLPAPVIVKTDNRFHAFLPNCEDYMLTAEDAEQVGALWVQASKAIALFNEFKDSPVVGKFLKDGEL